MAGGKKQAVRKTGSSAPATHVVPPAQGMPSGKSTTIRIFDQNPGWQTHLALCAVIIAATSLTLQACLGNTITTWDDPAYLRDNPFIKDLSWTGIRQIFSHPVMGNYHPLTILSFALEYSFVRLDPSLYHFDSLLLHTMTAVLVYRFVFLLTRRPVAALIAALLFAIHPMHTESVAWVSGRKDVLCGLFYMGACAAYMRYRAARASARKGWYTVVLLLFTCALLSKGVAVTLPLILLLIDYYADGTISRKAVLQKLPHLLMALALGIITVTVQRAAGAMAMQQQVFNVAERIALSCYALTVYLAKAMLPIGLHCLYPYPAQVHGSLPAYYYLYPSGIIAVIFLVVYYARRQRTWVFGLLFFLVNIALLLQLIPVGESLISERYTYLPYTGLFIIAGCWFSGFVSQPGRQYAWVIAAIWLGALGWLAASRCPVWYDERSLWTDEVANEPLLVPQAWNNLGCQYSRLWAQATDPAIRRTCYDSAMYVLRRAIALKPDYVNPLVAMGELQRSAGNLPEARATFGKAMRLHPTDPNLALELAICYYINQEYDSAGIYFRQERSLDSSSPTRGNYANYLEAVGKNEAALAEYNAAIALSNTNYVLFANRGKLLKKIRQFTGALADFDSAIRLCPDNGELYYLRSQCRYELHNFAAALHDLQTATTLGFTAIDSGYRSALAREAKGP